MHLDVVLVGRMSPQEAMEALRLGGSCEFLPVARRDQGRMTPSAAARGVDDRGVAGRSELPPVAHQLLEHLGSHQGAVHREDEERLDLSRERPRARLHGGEHALEVVRVVNSPRVESLGYAGNLRSALARDDDHVPYAGPLHRSHHALEHQLRPER